MLLEHFLIYMFNQEIRPWAQQATGSASNRICLEFNNIVLNSLNIFIFSKSIFICGLVFLFWTHVSVLHQMTLTFGSNNS